MRAVNLALLLCLGAVAVSAQYNQRPKTGAPTCVAPITNVGCFLDNHSGYVFGIAYQYGDHPFSRTMSKPLCNADLNSMGSVSQFDKGTPARPLPDGFPTSGPGQGQQFQNMNINPQVNNDSPLPADLGIVRVDVYKRTGLNTPAISYIPRNRGEIPVIEFHLAALDDPEQTPVSKAICGNTDLANTPGAIKLAYSLTNPTDHPLFLGDFNTKCSPRTLFPGGNPRGPIFYVKQLNKDCWAPSKVLFNQARKAAEGGFGPL